MEVLTMHKWLNSKMQKLVLGVTLAVLVASLAVFIGACESTIPDPETPEFEGTVLTEDDIGEMGVWGASFDAQGGAQNSTILLLHDFQEAAAFLVNALDASSDGDEIPLLLDVFYACSLSLQGAAANLTYPDSLVFIALGVENGIFGGNLGSIKQALREWIVTEHGASATAKAEDVFVGITSEMIQEVADLLGITPEDLRELLEDIPPSERLTWEGPGSVILQPSGVPYPQPSVPWWKQGWKLLKGGAKKLLAKVALPAKLASLVAQYGYAIADCYYNYFPDWTAIDDCLIEKHGLAPDVVTRIKDAILDP